MSKAQHILINDDSIVVFAGKGYADNVDVLCTIKDTGNGYIAHFPSYLCTRQDNYVCLDYSEAYVLTKALRKHFKSKGEWE